MNKILTRIEKNVNFWFLITISFIFFLLRLPSLFEPHWYGDEGIYQALGLGINAGQLLYRDIFDNKPPLLYLLYSFMGSDQFAIRLLSLIFGVISIWIFYYLAKKIISSTKAIFLATGIFAIFFGLPIIEGNIANAENFMLLLNIAAGLIIFISTQVKSYTKSLIFITFSGLILGLSFLFKIVAIFDFTAFLIFLIIVNFPLKITEVFDKKIFFNIFGKIVLFTLCFAIPIALTTLFFMLNNALPYFLKAALFNNVGYVGWGNKFIIPQGLLFIKASFLIVFTLFIFLKRNTLEKGFIFSVCWFAFSLFSALFSQRPYTHYVLVLLPSISLMFGLLFLNNKYSKLAGIVALSGFILVLLNFKFYTKIIPYYQNFVNFVIGNKSVKDYRYFFDHNTPRDYEIANYILFHKTKDSHTFLWGNNAQVYNLIDDLPPGRYTVAYHITGFKDGLENTKAGLDKKPPTFIIVMPNTSAYPFSLSSYHLKINLSGVNIYENINK